MKLIATVTLVLLFGFSLCHKETDHYRSKGEILGPDLRDCVCCGGWYIMIDTAEYEFDTLPAASGIDLQKESFPLKVRLDWQLNSGPACPYKRIDIIRLIKE